MKKTLKSQLFAAVAMMIVAVIVLTSATFAWFTSVANPVVDNMDLYVKTVDSMYLSELAAPDYDTPQDWKTLVTNADITAVQEDAFPVDTVSGDQVLQNVSSLLDADQFYRAIHDTTGNITGYAVLNSDNDTAAPNSEELDQNQNYVKFDLWVKSDNSGYIYLDTTAAIPSKVVAIDDIDGAVLTTEPGKGIANTIRVGFVPWADNAGTLEADYTSSVIWEPNSDKHIALGYYPPTVVAADIDGVEVTNKAVTGATTTDIATQTTDLGTTNIPLFDYTTGTASKFSVYIWVEGADVDTVNSVADSYVRTFLKFGQEKDTTMP